MLPCGSLSLLSLVPKRVGNQKGPEHPGPYVEKTSKLKHHETLAAAKKLSEFRAILGSGLKYAACTTNWFGHARVEVHREPESKLTPNSRIPTISRLSQIERTSIYMKC